MTSADVAHILAAMAVWVIAGAAWWLGFVSGQNTERLRNNNL